MCLGLAACASDDARPPTSPPPPPGGGAIQVNGTESLGWEQPAPSVDALRTYGYLAYVDDVAVELAGANCASTAGANGFACSARLPPMTPGNHSIQLTAYVDQGGRLESGKSSPVLVRLVPIVAAVIAGVGSDTDRGAALRRIATVDGVALQVQVVGSGLVDPTDLAVAPDGRVFVAERAGRVRVFRDGQWVADPALVLTDVETTEGGEAGGLLALAIDPAFEDNGALYAVYTTASGFRLARFDAAGDAFRNRAILLDGVEMASARPGAVLRVGPDRKLYVAFDDGGDARQAGDLGSFNGKVLRLNVDGTTPIDQPGGTPVYALDVNRPTSLEWSHDGATLWVGEHEADGADRLQAVAGPPARRGTVHKRYTLPPDMGAGGAAFYWSAAIPAFRGNLFIAAGTTRGILRVRFESPVSNVIAGTEWLLRNELGPIRAIGAAPDGGLYFCTADALVLVTPEG